MLPEPFAITLAGYIGFFVALIVASGAMAAIRFEDEHLSTNDKFYARVLAVCSVVGIVLIVNTGALKEVRLRSKQFKHYCKSAHITVNKTVSGVQGVYFSDGDHCRGHINSNYLSWCEQLAYRIDIEPDKPYERQYRNNSGTIIFERVKEPRSTYAVTIKGITTELDKQLGIGGAEKTILNRDTGEILAVARRYALGNGGSYQTCPTTSFRHLEMYVLGYGPEKVRKRISGAIEQARRKGG